MRQGRILLDDPGLVWVVEDGEACVRAEPGPQAGLARCVREMARFGPGDVVLGLAPEPGDGRLTLYLDTGPETRLKAVLAEDFTPCCRAQAADMAQPLARLARQLAALIHPDIPPSGVVKLLAPGGAYRLQPGMRVCARDEDLWFLLDSGVCAYGGADFLAPLAPGGVYALAGGLWLEIRERSRLIGVSTEQMAAAGRAMDTLSGLAALARIAVLEGFSREALASLAATVRSARHRRTMLGQALERSAEVAEGVGRGDHPAPSALVGAVRLVCRAMGQEVQDPPRLDEDPARQLEDVLAVNGLCGRMVRLEGDWRRQGAAPLLGFHRTPGRPAADPVALIPGGRGCDLEAPRTGERRPVDRETSEALGTAAMQLYPPLPGGRPGPMALFRHGLKGAGRDAAGLVLAGLAAGLCGFALPMALSTTVDVVIPHGDMGLLTQIMLGLALFVLGGAVFETCKAFALLRVESRGQVSLQSGVMARLLALPMAFFSRYTAGDLATRVSAVDQIRRKLSGAVLVTLLSSAFSLANLFLLFLYSPLLSLAVAVILGLALGFMYVVMKKQMRFQASIENSIGKISGLELQLVSGITKLRAAGAEANAYTQWLNLFNEMRRITFTVGLGGNVLATWNAGLPLFSSLAVFSLYLLMGGPSALSLGGFLCFNAAMGQLTQAMAALAQTAYSLMFLAPSYQRLRPVLEAEPETRPGQEDPGDLRGTIEVNGVSFAYEGASAPALRGVSLRIEPGQFVALVGESGSGKSTLLKLLLGFHDPAAGAVLFDGKALSRLDKGKVRRQIGTIIQNGELFQGNILFNIMGASAGDEDAAWEAARVADVERDIRDMPMGLHTFVPHGGGAFSGGQKQRLLIARAVARKPRIVIMDEATSCLDNLSQARVMANLHAMQATRVVAAHRLSTVEKADLIVVMQAGRMVEAGTFDQLMRAKGLFARMAARQRA